MIFGYARCSSVSQSLDIQIEALKAAGCEVIRSEKKSGTTREGREELDLLLAFLRPGDVLMVVKIDRLARSISDLLNIARTLREKGASLRTVDGMSFDDTPTGTLLMQILGVVAEFENALRKERQLAGIAAAKLRGIYRGRPATI
jgi:DNA invertase Pin-like site-specific DNA recombinase